MNVCNKLKINNAKATESSNLSYEEKLCILVQESAYIIDEEIYLIEYICDILCAELKPNVIYTNQLLQEHINSYICSSRDIEEIKVHINNIQLHQQNSHIEACAQGD